MKLEEILPEIRKGRKARRPHWHEDAAINGRLEFVSLEGGRIIVQQEKFNSNELLADDWELVPEPVRVADYLVPSSIWNERIRWSECWLKETHPIGSQPEGSVMVPGSER